MGPLDAAGSVLSKILTFDGRASRSEFWWWAMIQSFAILAAFILDIALLDPTTALSDIGFFSFFTPFVILFLFIPSLSVTVRRLHDIGRSGLWILISFVPLGGVVLLVFYVLPSQDRDNAYGQPPGGMPYVPRGSDIAAPFAAPRKPVKNNAFASYAILAEGKAEPSAEMRDAQREQVRAYYRQKVLGQSGTTA